MDVSMIFNDYNFDDKPFENPLENICFIYYLFRLNNNKYYDPDRLCNDYSYLQNAYNEYLENLVEFCRPKFPPDIKVEDITKLTGNSFMVYRKNFIEWLEIVGIKISNQQIISSFVSKLWESESNDVKRHYKNISDRRRELHNERLLQYI